MSTNTKHTPGPWAISRHATPEYAPQFGVYSESDDAGRDLAIAKGSNAEANAALIAAAPELLAALELISVDKDGDGFICREGMDQVRAAIAKAKGGAA